MSARPSDIPESVWEAAVVIAGTVLRNLPDDYGDVSVEVAYIARVMLAAEKRGEERERERCLLAVAEQRCERGTPWDMAIIAAMNAISPAAAIRNPSHTNEGV